MSIEGGSISTRSARGTGAAGRNDTANVSINGLKGTPLMVGDTLYLSTPLSQVAAIDAATGATRWVYDPESYAAGIPIIVLGFSSRGLA